MLPGKVIALAMLLVPATLNAMDVSNGLREGQVLISRDSSRDMTTYETKISKVSLQRVDDSSNEGAEYLVSYSGSDNQKASYRFDATPKVEAFDIVGLEVTRALCNREMAIVTLREYTNLEGPLYLYSRVFLELTKAGAGFVYEDLSAPGIGGPVPLGLLEEYATVDCQILPVELTDKRNAR